MVKNGNGFVIQDIEMVRGDTMEFVTVIDGTTDTVSAVSFSCRTKADASTYVFQKTLSDGVTSLGDGQYKVRVAPADTASQTPGFYDYDLQFTIGNNIYTPLIGKLRLMQDVTHS